MGSARLRLRLSAARGRIGGILGAVTITAPPVPTPGEPVEPLRPPPSVEAEMSVADRRKRLSRPWRDIIEVAALALGLYVVVSLALQTVRVDGVSMVPTLINGDLLFADKLSFHLRAPERGDIIVLKPPGDINQDFIKRVIGVPGDTIEIDTSTSSDGSRRASVLIKPAGSSSFERLSEPYLSPSDPWTDNGYCCDAAGRATVQPQPLTIPRNEYFVMGDNRNISEDSRTLGLIPRANVVARAWVRIWPAGHLGALGTGPALVAAGVPVLPGLLLLRRRRRVQRRLARAHEGG
jgi:signal peptidase I